MTTYYKVSSIFSLCRFSEKYNIPYTLISIASDDTGILFFCIEEEYAAFAVLCGLAIEQVNFTGDIVIVHKNF